MKKVSRAYKPWTDKEDQVIRDLAGKMSRHDIAAKLERPLTSIDNRAIRMGISLAFESHSTKKGEKRPLKPKTNSLLDSVLK